MTASVPAQISVALRPRLKKIYIGRIMLEIDHDNLFSHYKEWIK